MRRLSTVYASVQEESQKNYQAWPVHVRFMETINGRKQGEQLLF